MSATTLPAAVPVARRTRDGGPLAARRPGPARRVEMPADGLTDGELVERAKAGDLTAFDPLYRRHAARVLGLARRLSNGDPWAADDIAAQTWADAMGLIGTFDTERVSAGFPSWLFAIAANRARDIMRARGHERPIDLATVPDDLIEAPALLDDPCDPAVESQREELIGRLYEALEHLTARERQVIEARIDAERPCEIAARLGLSAAAVGSAFTTARHHLRSLLTTGQRGRVGTRGLGPDRHRNEQLAALVAETGLSLSALGRQLGVRHGQIRKWLAGAQPQRAAAEQLAGLLTQRLGRPVSVDDLGLSYKDDSAEKAARVRFGQELRKARLARGWTIGDLAAELLATRRITDLRENSLYTYIGTWERGVNRVQDHHRAALVELLGLIPAPPPSPAEELAAVVPLRRRPAFAANLGEAA